MIPKLLPLYAALAVTLAPSACRKPITTVTPSGVSVPIDAPPPTFVRSTAEVRTTHMIDVREGLQKADAFKLLGDGLSARFVVDVSDPRAGFMMTRWKNTFVREGIPDLRYRTRIVARFVGDNWNQLALQVEANWRPRGEEWEVGFDNVLLQEVEADLKLRLGK